MGRRSEEDRLKTAEGLEIMAETVDIQDKLLTTAVNAAQDAVGVADKAQTTAGIARNLAAHAEKQVKAVDDRVSKFENQTVLQKFQWFFRGPWW